MAEVAKLVGVSEGTVSRWESGIISNMRRDKVFALSKVLDMNPIDVMQLRNENEEAAHRRIPVLGTVTAGKPIDRIEYIDGYELIPAEWSGEHFALRIKGNSMEPKISDGDVVIVKRQASAEDGQIVIAAVNGDEATCKMFRRVSNTVILQPLNPAYTPIVWDGKSGPAIKILGKVVELRSRFY